MLTVRSILLASSALMFAAPALAQGPAPAADAQASADSQGATDAKDEIVVTAVARGQNRLDSSVSVSSINAGAIANAAPRSAAELFRSLPGIRSESSGG
ncbi:MAG: TonB-dependent receptor, partial [Novosphingobium sp.]|nr:TonB-dependent receptor [Novosphingobium sp.]